MARPWGRKPEPGPEESPAEHPQHELGKLLAILKKRHLEGRETMLRQLHSVFGIDQPRVLRLLREMQEAGLARVETNLHDPLGSRIALTRTALDACDEVQSQD